MNRISSPLVVIKPAPFNAESDAAALRTRMTPNAAFFVRSNFDIPALDPAEHRIEVAGAVTHPGAWSLSRLVALGMRSEIVTLECAGNDRLGMAPLPPGELWGGGAVSTAEWRGVPLASLLAAVGPAPSATHVYIEGGDRGVIRDRGGEAIPFARALELEQALRPEVLLATTMNGAPLPREHGAPLRLVVPGWYGMASVKWVTRIELRSEPFDGWFQRDRYVFRGTERSAPGPVERMRVKSRITTPGAGEVVPPGPVTLRGMAWSGTGPVTRVEFAIGGGEKWQQAELGPAAGDWAWRPFSATFVAEAGRQTIRTRATDAAGNVQPERVEWNALGYGNNAILPVVFDVQAPDGRLSPR